MDVDPPIHALHAPDEPRHSRRYASANDQREALIERDLNDVYLLMDYLSGRPDRCISDLTMPNPADPAKPLNLVDAVCRIRWPLPGCLPLHAGQPRESWKLGVCGGRGRHRDWATCGAWWIGHVAGSRQLQRLSLASWPAWNR